MFKHEITYTDFDGNKRTETLYFNLTKAELLNMELGTKGGMENLISRIVEEEDVPRIVELFSQIIDKSYGKKSDDGKRFMKSDEILKEFKETQAYSDFYFNLATDTEFAIDFINAIVPSELVQSDDSNKALPAN